MRHPIPLIFSGLMTILFMVTLVTAMNFRAQSEEAKTQNLSVTSTTTDTSEPAWNTYEGYPAFQYPSDWHVAIMEDHDITDVHDAYHTIYAGPEPVIFCTTCIDGSDVEFTIERFSIGFIDMATWIADEYPGAETNTDVYTGQNFPYILHVGDAVSQTIGQLGGKEVTVIEGIGDYGNAVQDTLFLAPKGQLFRIRPEKNTRYDATLTQIRDSIQFE